MGESLERIFVGWHRPFLELAVPAWCAYVQRRALDPAACVIVVPGQRAGRRLEERIAELAPSHWPPARVVTEGTLAAALSSQPLQLASDWQRAFAWRRALAASPQEERDALWRDAGAQSVQVLARACARTFAELAAEKLDTARIAFEARNSAQLGAAERWRALDALFVRYRELLASRALLDPAEAALEVVKRACVRAELHVQLFALVDVTRAQRELLARSDVASFVFAPQSESGAFDPLGALRIEAWAERDLDLPLDRWACVDTPDDQARAALEHLARVEPPPAPEDVTVGVLDPDVRPYLERRLLELDIEPRWAGGKPLAHSRPAQLLAAAMAWLAQPSTEHFAALIRHSDVERVLGFLPGELVRAFDIYAAEHVPARIDGHWLARSEDAASRARAELLSSAFERLRELLGEFASESALSCVDWATRMAKIIVRVWPEADLASRADQDWTQARALDALATLVDEMREAERDGPPLPLSAPDVLELIAQRLEALQLPPAPVAHERACIELVGGLELLLDDAPQLVISGVNEGSLPAPTPADAWLFEAARRVLELAHERRRVARDSYFVAAILASRPSTLWVSGRRSSRRDPRVPSRFVFRSAARDEVERVRRAWPEREEERPPVDGVRARYVPPTAEVRAPRSISVTAFGSYLNSPYEFYVRHVLRLESVADEPHELDAANFGSLTHAVLERFGRSAWSASSDATAIADCLGRELDRRALELYGAAARPAVRLQVEKLRKRLEAFALWQAEQVRRGWTIHAVEFVPAARELAGLLVHGRIDRIDFHPGRKEWRLIDYKTGDGGKPPKQVHRRRDQWRDLQLPLYRWLTEELWAPGGQPPKLGYVSLDKRVQGERWLELELSDLDYEAALECARSVAAAIARREFQGVAARAPFDESLAALCGFGLAEAQHESDDAEEDVE